MNEFVSWQCHACGHQNKDHAKDTICEKCGMSWDLSRARHERDNWKETAAQHLRNEQFYSGLLDETAAHLGPDVFVSEDGSKQGSPLRLKIPSMVGNVVADVARLNGLLSELANVEEDPPKFLREFRDAKAQVARLREALADVEAFLRGRSNMVRRATMRAGYIAKADEIRAALEVE